MWFKKKADSMGILQKTALGMPAYECGQKVKYKNWLSAGTILRIENHREISDLPVYLISIPKFVDHDKVLCKVWALQSELSL